MQPALPPDPVDAESMNADTAACRALIRNGSKSFFAASLLLPRRVREPALALYAFCRLADDAIDGTAEAPALDPSAARLDRLHARLDRIYTGSPGDIPADRAFARVIEKYRVPRDLPESLLEAFDWDLQLRRYRDLPELLQYAARVAGSVGAMMACLMEVRGSEAMTRANDLGMAMQLTNIARDVGEDARAGRLYLPLSWLEQVGIDSQEWLQAPAFSAGLRTVVSKLLAAADTLYAQAEEGIEMLPRDCRPGIRAAARLYAEIGHELRRRGGDSVNARTVVPGWRKGSVLAAVILESSVPRPDKRVEWLVGLFERLERRDRSPAGSCTPPG